MSQSRLIQHVTNFLQRVEYSEIKYPENRVTMIDDYSSLKELRRRIYTNDTTPVVLIVYNMSTKDTIDLYLRVNPNFQLIIQSPMLLYSDEVETVYNNDETNNMYMTHSFTPHYSKIYDEALNVIQRLGISKVLVLGPEDYEKDNIIYTSDTSIDADDIELVIDTMINSNFEYVNFVESIDRASSFNNVIYYRLMDKVSLDLLSMGKKSDKNKIIMEALNYNESFKRYFTDSELKEYERYITPLSITKSEKERMLSNDLDLLSSLLYVRASKSKDRTILSIIAIMLSDSNYITDIIEYPTFTYDPSFDMINKYRVMKLLKEEYGYGLFFLISLFTSILHKLSDIVQEGMIEEEVLNSIDMRHKIYSLLENSNINSRIVANVLTKIGDAEILTGRVFNTTTMKSMISEILGVYGNREMKHIGMYYYDNSDRYSLNTSYIPQEFIKLPDTIIPLVTDEETVYLWL